MADIAPRKRIVGGGKLAEPVGIAWYVGLSQQT